MQNLDVIKFRQLLLDATEKAFVEAKSICEGGQLYGFSLFLVPLGSVVAAVGQSEEGLEKAVSEECASWTCATGNLTKLLSKSNRWECTEWPYFEHMFEATSSLLFDSYESDQKDYYEGGTTRLVFLCCLEILAELDVHGIFGKGKQRESIVLNVNVGDQGNEEILGNARRINPYEVYKRFSEEFHEGRAVFKELTYIGPS